MADARDTGTGMMTWLGDQWGAAAAGASSTEVDFGAYPAPAFGDLEDALVPSYIQVLPSIDGWRSRFDYRLDLSPDSDRVMGIRSGGRDGAYSGSTYVARAFDPTAYDQDIVWTDGFFVRWPQKLTN